MDRVDVIAVVGTSVEDRGEYARWLADLTDREFISAQRLALSPDPVDEAVALAPWCRSRGAVIEFPRIVPTVEMIGALAESSAATRLCGIVCVVDAPHLLADLQRDSYARRHVVREGHALDTQHVAHAMLAVTQIEFASTVVLAHWEALPTAELAMLMALIAHLSPRARLRLQSVGADQPASRDAYGVGQERPGWVALLNDEFVPHMTDRRVGAFRYLHERPLHPERLRRLLDERIEKGEFGNVIRSAGFCRLATRFGTVARWDHVGSMISFDPLASDDDLAADGELLSLGQDIGFIGIDLRERQLAAALDEAALTDEEFAAGADLWADLVDPFPAWETARDLWD